ncbi:MAG: hypothetical protein KatS3mg113_0651 [Planctomycetaceae bacterium]|nr:MAG: hypothetical protein KatS3mg113_0651 [Planctomycetaceae bacterium]
MWGLVLPLGALLLALSAGLWLLRQHGPRALRPLSAEALEIQGQRFLARGVTLHQVRWGSRLLLVALGPEGAQTLAETTDPIEIALLSGASKSQATVPGAFARIFQRAHMEASVSRAPATTSSPPQTVLEVDGV